MLVPAGAPCFKFLELCSESRAEFSGSVSEGCCFWRALPALGVAVHHWHLQEWLPWLRMMQSAAGHSHTHPSSLLLLYSS